MWTCKNQYISHGERPVTIRLNWLKGGSEVADVVMCTAYDVCVYAKRRLNHFQLPAPVITAVQGLLNHPAYGSQTTA